MQKVLFVATVNTHIKAFHIPYLKWFKEQGFEVHVACSPKTGYESGNEVALNPEIPYCDVWHNVPFARSPFDKTNISAYKELKHIIDSNDFSIIHSHTPVGGVLTRIAAKKARKNGTKSIYTAHGFHFFKGASRAGWLIFYPIEKYLSKYTDHLITINEEDYHTATSRGFKAKTISKVNGVGVNTEHFSPRETEKDISVLKEFGLGKDDFILLSVGELNTNKNHRVIIEALSKLDNSSVKYIICGSGSLKDELLSLADSLGVLNQVIFAGFRTDTDRIYKISDVFVFPSYREGLPVSTMEAMGSGLPVIASNIRGNRDLIVDGKGGFLIDNPADAHSFAEKISFLYNESALRSEFGSYNVKTVKDFSIDNVMKQMLDIYNLYI